MRTYGWKQNDRLTAIDDSALGPTRYAHDAVGNLAATIFADGAQQLRTPDAVGNLFQTAARSDRRYGPAGQLLEAKGKRYDYDEAGNLRQRILPTGAQWHYSWNAAGHLAEVVRPDGGVVRFAYDALGRRVSKSYRGQVTRWVWDGNQPLHEWTELELNGHNTDDVITWLFEPDSFAPLAKLQGADRQSIVCDHLGTPLEMHDGRGQLSWAAELDSYGAVRKQRGEAGACPFRYQGQYEDVETGLYYNRFRYYDPHSGQYVSQDPIGLMGGDALYAYVHDPTGWVDEFGLTPCPKAAEILPKLRGKSVPAVQKTLKKKGFSHRNPANPKNERWTHADGSEVQIHKYGNGNTTPYKSGNNAHIHKSVGKHGNAGTIELNDRGRPSPVASETHIGIKNPADYPIISGRPHGT